MVAATKANDVETARRLILAGADVNAKDDLDDSAYLYAGAEGLDEILVLTLDHGADVRSLNRFGGTALIPAAEKGHPTTVQLLIDAGVPLDHINYSGWTALLEAVVYGDDSAPYQDIVARLLAAGANPDIRDAQGRTALNNARNLGQTDIVRLLGG
ncbi:ankyrin repeat domain-containing protein [Williamsia muralis]|uniref:ankyrin repeat domain-containing protein n=1 Tax=Williamsia marianensis TaxID=85044 RepID=UPI001FE3CE1C|nr:ankyrin repeat domain-containing protein [Williamsia muralis]